MMMVHLYRLAPYLGAYVLACSRSFCPASLSFKIASPESVTSRESQNLVYCSRMNSIYLCNIGTVVGLKKKKLQSGAGEC
jgi:hypothetical protein